MNLERSCRYLAWGLLLVFLALPCRLMGHTLPQRSEPRVGATVTSPRTIRIWFDGALDPAASSIIVKDASGKRVDKGDGHVDAKNEKLLEIGVADLRPGTYRVFWKVVARDGHRTSGDYRFTVR